MLVIIDNYDSFTYNIVQTIAGSARKEGREEDIRVYRNDKISIAEIEAMRPDRLLVSPGPCSPQEAGISIAAIRYFSDKVPVLGVCLGHQSMGEAFGGRTIRARRIMHGKTSPIHHDGKGIFTGLANPFDGMRYHSLILEEETLPGCLTITARTDEGELMAIRHKTLPVEGVQFHPESIMTPAGIRLLQNFMSPDYQRMVNG
ncbi:aminodeoxychorismate/anthranilate synthase component II [Desulfoprunum benzoelyticum]|uniref:Anthranilate synthase/aminodeoxychorismate synthase-like glutamine amidotransferase n=1 Tax=Desulfoprunum benzoelyticum TaxID=1506996 RepID=A0A840UWZ2_9BACT|nr:aminodeoxychorismate/anthranilate synthase component II [Desulfoprunum benzoelyticum]MBB5349346.1 anthranilate synthase/aminodeoxychorismate synthase-like glutamine amidotransferase [Desulfoprunum benzoelyticum]MBM9531078.1 aminodeoxychorismate/anthranilate synthase component II [Desulfoprunum benzoelyticum]